MNPVWFVLKRIFGFFPAQYSIVFLLRLLGHAGLGLLTGVVIKAFFDRASASTLTAGAVYTIVALMIAIPLVQAAAYWLDLALSYSKTDIFRGLFRRNLFRFVLEKPGAVPLPVAHGQLVNMLRSDVSAPESLLWDMMYFIAYVLVSAAGLAMLAAIDWRLAVALLLPLLLSIAVMQLVKRSITRHYERLQQATDTLTGFLGELFRHQETVRLNDAEPAFLRRLQTIAANRAAAGKRSAVLDTALASLYDNIVSVCTALLLLFIAVSMRSGSFSAGSLPFFLIVFGFVSGAIRLFGTVTGDYRKASAALARISGLLGGGAMETLTRRDPLYLQGEPPAPAAPVQAEPLACLELRRIGYTFPGTDAGIRDVSLRLPRGTITVVTGTVGAGKTTLVRTLLGLLPATSGDIVWNGRRIDSPEMFLLPPAAAYVPQLAVLFSGTIRGNIGGGELDEPTIRAALHAAVLEDDVAQFPDGLETVIGPKGKRLSGGQQQRVAVARMAASQAQLWVLDDSASGLDAETERLMWQRIDALRRSDAITCIIVSTKPYVLPYADQIVVMRDGCIDTSMSRLLA